MSDSTESIFPVEVQNDPKHQRFGFWVDETRRRVQAKALLRQNPAYRELEENLNPTGNSTNKFERGILRAEREGTVETLVNGVWVKATEIPQPTFTEAPASSNRRDRR